MAEHISFAQRIRIRLFLEGYEIPIISAQVTAAASSPAQCVIQVPPLVEGTRLYPRTIVHLFFLDGYEVANPFLHDSSMAGTPQDNQPDPNSYDKQQNKGNIDAKTVIAVPCGDTAPKQWSNRRYKLLFGGEIIGFSWGKTPVNRSLVFQCADWSNYWDYAYQWSNTSIFGPGLKAVFSGGATNLFTDFLSTPGSAIVGVILQGKCNAFPKLKGLAAGVIALIEAIGGSYYSPPDATGNNARKFAGQNIFFSMAELRLHITQMIAAYEDDPTSRQLLSAGGFAGLFGRVLGGLGEQVSIRAAITAVSKLMFHETYAQPCPYFIAGTGNDAQGTRRVRITDHPILSSYAKMSLSWTVSLVDLSTTLKNMEAESADSKPYDQASALATKQDQKSTLQDAKLRVAAIRSTLNQLVARFRGGDCPGVFLTILQTVAEKLGRVTAVLMDWTPEQPQQNYYKQTVNSNLTDAIQELKRIPQLTFNELPLKTRTPPRLAQHICRPDIWFGPPPRCNVLFPDMYQSLNYQRMFLQEPTRFMLKTNDEFFGEDFLFDKFYFAPQAGSLKKDHANIMDVLQNDILDHEIFTGILPVYEKMGEFNIFAARKNERNPGKTVPKVSYAQRSANFIYFKHRFNSRQFQVEARFNPYIAVGFPGLIIDKWVDEATAARIRQLRDKFIALDPAARNALLPKYTAELLGTNFLANFAEVTHQVAQDQMIGNTSIRCNYARQPSESIEFLGTMAHDQTVQKRQSGDAVRTTVVAGLTAPALHSLGPNQGVITNIRDVTDKYSPVKLDSNDPLTGASDAPQRLPVFYGGMRRGGPPPPKIQVPVGVPIDLANEPLMAAFFGTTGTVKFSAYAVDEEVPRYKLEKLDFPAEELIRPGWYGDCWGPAKIGATYRTFFGIGSIVDQTVITDPRSGAVGSAYEKYKQDVAEAADDPTNPPEQSALADQPIVTSLESGASIEQAVEFLTLTYSYVKQAEMDVDEFIRAYTWRPIATMLDMFGSENLQFNETGTMIVSTGSVEGFHSRAFGPYDDIYGLVSPEIEDVLKIKRGGTAAQRGDTRKRKQQAVQDYLAKLNFSRVLIG